jgi:hypothetical protein
MKPSNKKIAMKEEDKEKEIFEGALKECELWKGCLTIGLTYPEWRKRHYKKKKDIDHVRKLIQAYENVELYLQNKLNEINNHE